MLRDVLVALAIITLLILLILAASISGGTLTRPKVRLVFACQTQDCYDHGHDLKYEINESVNPCEDLHAFVCGKSWLWNSTSESQLQRFNRQVTAVRSSNLFPQLKHSTAITTVFLAYKSCVQRRHDNNSLAVFAAFMKSRRIPWPLPPLDGVEPIDVLLELSIDWNIWVLFQLRAVRWYNDNLVIILGQLNIASGWWGRSLMSDSRKSSDYVRTLAVALNGTTTLSDRDVELLLNNEKLLLGNFSKVGAEGQDELLVRLREAPNVLPSVSTDAWLWLLSKYLGTVIPVTDNTLLLAYNRKLFTVLEAVLRQFNRVDLLNLIGWVFASSYSWVATTEFDKFRWDGEMMMGNPIPGLCFFNMKETYGPLPSVIPFYERFTGVHRTTVDDMLLATVSTLLGKIESADTTNATKMVAKRKLETMTRIIGPPTTFFQGNWLDETYAPFPRPESTSFVSSWIWSKAILKRVSTKPQFMTPAFKEPWTDFGSVEYSYRLNTLLVGLWSMFPPNHYWEGSPSMSFSGLGFEFARKLAMSIDHEGRQIDDSLQLRSWWEGGSGCRRNQSRAEKRGTLNLFAVNLAFQALHDYLSSQSRPENFPPEEMEKYTGDQMFYISYCKHQCRKGSGRALCNVAMNSSNFTATFRCSGTSGNSELSDCSFF